MYLFGTFGVVAAVSSLVSAHGSRGVPQVVGINTDNQSARELLSNLAARLANNDAHEHTALDRRQGTQCGAGIGSCPQGQCCSQYGSCGTGDTFCYSPGCDYQHGPGCPENNPPKGENTSTIVRTKAGSVAYGGTGIFKCVTPGQVALTYDDGPMKTFTSHILDLFKSYDAKGTFFITGNNINKGQIDTTQEYIDVIKRMDAEGHQIASHAWTHLDLSKISSADRKNQMYMNEMALRNIVNKIPTYMRPPYSSCEAECQKDMADLGYHITYFDVNTDDYTQNKAETVQFAKDWFKGNITEVHNPVSESRRLSITHDIIDQTANNLTEFMLSFLKQNNFKAVTVGECLGDPKANWYRGTDGSIGSSANSTQTSSTEGSNNGTSSNSNNNPNDNGKTNGNGNNVQTGGNNTSGEGTQDAPNSATASIASGLFLSIAFSLSFLFAL